MAGQPSEYQAHFYDHGNRVFYTASFTAEHDAAAISHASRVFASGIGKRYEIRQDDRLIHANSYP